MRRALVAVALVAGCAGCASSPPVREPAALDVPKLVATAPSAPVAAPPSVREDWDGVCGGHEVGNPAPPIRHMPRHIGNVVLVYFWATWCEPCKKDFPAYAEIYERYKGRGLEAEMVSIDDEPDATVDFPRTHQWPYQFNWDQHHHDAECWRIDAMPNTFIVDRKGIIRFAHQGSDPDLAERVAKEIDSLL